MALVKSKPCNLDKKVVFNDRQLLVVEFVIGFFCVFASLVIVVLRRIACATDNEKQASDCCDGGDGLFHGASFVKGYF